ncbi:collagen-like protein, partial [Synechocystis sp. LEGE 06083]|uniref:collagen-like triple helix repeat-containing protein n=1 Tax=Synechocystis sp. LEGE 06083 TaxID=915336 RepID=UPI001880FDBD
FKSKSQSLDFITRTRKKCSEKLSGERVLSGVQNLAAVLASISVVGGGIYAFANWQAQSDSRAAEVDKNIRIMGNINAELRDELGEVRRELAEALDRIDSIEKAKSERLNSGTGPSADKVAAVLVQQHLEEIRGPKGDRGDPGPIGPRGPEGVASTAGQDVDVSGSNAFLPLDFSKITSGIRLGGFEWGVPQCDRSGLTVKCEALLKNDSGEDVSNYSFYPNNSKTQAFSDVLTNHALSAFSSKSWDKKFDQHFWFSFPAGIVYPITWEVVSVPVEAKGFARMDLYTGSGLASFKNVPIN